MLAAFDPTAADVDWMCRLYLQGAAKGHFYNELNGKPAEHVVRRNFIAIVEQHCLFDFDLRARAIVFCHKRKRIGYVVMTDIKSIPDAFEIHLFMVDRKRRRSGFGRRMLQHVIDDWNSQNDLYVRCFPVSAGMIHLLERSGFEFQKINSEGARLYRKTAISEVAMACQT